MAEAEEHIELKFRIYDGTDIAHSNYVPSTTVATLKQRLVTEWPQGYCFFFFLQICAIFFLLTIYCALQILINVILMYVL